LSSRLSLVLKAAHQLGIPSLVSYARYQLGLRSGYYRRVTSSPPQIPAGVFQPVIHLPSRQELTNALGEQTGSLLEEAAEIVQGRVRLFGGKPVPLELVPPSPLAHWTAYDLGSQSIKAADVKFIWEPARFGWAFTLGRAYLLTGDESYPQSFWEQVETFLAANPPYQGPNWCSGQEVGLRLLALVFALQVFAPSPQTTTERATHLTQAIAAHATRIPPTLVYARAQNNNHLLTEAAGLYTAGLALAEHPSSPGWRELGWRIFNRALQAQIASDGGYIQHSTNYHRLMLQAALWTGSLTTGNQPPPALPLESRLQLAAATNWLMALVDPSSGRVPNLGPNDGANILPFSSCPFDDFRPITQAAASAYLGERPLPSGPWDEMRLWFRAAALGGDKVVPLQGHQTLKASRAQPHILRNPSQVSWAYLRAARFDARPGHADQLHMDLWWRGLNVALDPGTYLYNTSPPWDNSLARTDVHNTITLNGHDQMTRAGRFLWLDWAQAQIASCQIAEDGSLISLTAQHNGYLQSGVLHKRSIEPRQHGWWVKDELLPCGRRHKGKTLTQARLHWLLPDWPWELTADDSQEGKPGAYCLRVQSAYGWVNLQIQTTPGTPNQGADTSQHIQLVRAGELLSGNGKVSPIWGWTSPTYNLKLPALSFSIYQAGTLPLSYTSRWVFP
jgi:hypothetical protein